MCLCQNLILWSLLISEFYSLKVWEKSNMAAKQIAFPWQRHIFFRIFLQICNIDLMFDVCESTIYSDSLIRRLNYHNLKVNHDLPTRSVKKNGGKKSHPFLLILVAGWIGYHTISRRINDTRQWRERLKELSRGVSTWHQITGWLH